jgi:hypothetical protein
VDRCCSCSDITGYLASLRGQPFLRLETFTKERWIENGPCGPKRFQDIRFPRGRKGDGMSTLSENLEPEWQIEDRDHYSKKNEKMPTIISVILLAKSVLFQNATFFKGVTGRLCRPYLHLEAREARKFRIQDYTFKDNATMAKATYNEVPRTLKPTNPTVCHINHSTNSLSKSCLRLLMNATLL